MFHTTGFAGIELFQFQHCDIVMMRMKLVSGHQQCCELLDGSIPLPPLTLDCIQPIMMVFNCDDDDADNDEDIIKKNEVFL